MYIKRKVFSLGEGNIDYDYNIYQQLYSEAFEEGVNYAIEKMFNERKKKTTEEDLRREASHAGNRIGRYWTYNDAALSPSFSDARAKIRESIKEGKSDDEVREEAHKEFEKSNSRISKIAAGIGAVGGGISGDLIHREIGRKGGKLGRIGSITAGAAGLAGVGYGGSKLIDRPGKRNIDNLVDDALTSRSEMRRSERR